MKPKHWLAFAAALTGCAVAYGIHLSGSQETKRPQTSGKTAAKERRVSGFKPVSDRAGPQRVRPTSRQQPDQSVAAQASNTPPPVPRRSIEGSPDRRELVMPESQWHANAARVEMEANHELNRLATLLDLDPVQQEKVFASVARQSPYWLPGMKAGGVIRSTDGVTGQADSGASPNKNHPGAGNGKANPSQPAVIIPGSTPVVSGQPSGKDEPPLTAYLNPDQQEKIINDEMDRLAWWEEMLPQLLPPDFGEVAVAAAAIVPEEEQAAAPEIKPYEGGGEILEE